MYRQDNTGEIQAQIRFLLFCKGKSDTNKMDNSGQFSNFWIWKGEIRKGTHNVSKEFFKIEMRAPSKRVHSLMEWGLACISLPLLFLLRQLLPSPLSPPPVKQPSPIRAEFPNPSLSLSSCMSCYIPVYFLGAWLRRWRRIAPNHYQPKSVRVVGVFLNKWTAGIGQWAFPEKSINARENVLWLI